MGKNYVITPWGDKVFLDKNNSLGLRDDVWYDEIEGKLVKAFVKSGDIAIDIGTMIGWYSLLFANIVGVKGKVFGFEPEPSHYDLLRINMTVNRHVNFVLVNRAVANKNGVVKLFLSEVNLGMHNIGYDVGGKTINIEAIRVDDYLKTWHRGVQFIKMDIQGAETIALKGMDRVLRENENLKIIMEWYPTGARVFGGEGESLELLASYDFVLFVIDRRGQKLEKIDDLDEFIKEYLARREEGKFEFTNMFCCKKSTLKEVISKLSEMGSLK